MRVTSTNVAKLIRSLRLGAGISQATLAKRAGVAVQCVCTIETRRRVPRADTFIRLIEALEKTVQIA
jgi:DNA-binding XRE family transcriptional regulator